MSFVKKITHILLLSKYDRMFFSNKEILAKERVQLCTLLTIHIFYMTTLSQSILVLDRLMCCFLLACLK